MNVSICVVLTLALGASSVSEETGCQPNILWISAEDISPDLGCYGDAEARTPNLDKLASEGVRFANAFSVSGVCAPSRSAIITGTYPTTIGTHHMRCKAVPPSYVKCFTEYLRAAGYYCTNNVKTDYNFDCPATAWDECSRKAHWRGRTKNQPFFSVFNLTVSHESRVRAAAKQFARLTKDLKENDRHDPTKAKLPPYYPDTPVTRKDWSRYYDLVTAMDLQVGAILKQLADDGLNEKTIVFFFSDHGRGLPRAKRWTYDSGIRIPLIVRWPGIIRPNTVRDDLISFVDFAPTLLSLAGVKIPSHFQGRVCLGEKSAPPRKYIFAARDRMDETYDIIRAVRDKRFKYIRNFQAWKPYAQRIDYMDKMPTMQEMRRLNKRGELVGPQKLFFLPEKPEEELYDTSADPHEINNLASSPEHQQTLKRLRGVLEQWMKDTKDLGLIPEDELKERMRPGGKWATTAKPIITPDGGIFAGPVTVTIQCITQGASVAYTTDKADRPHWKLYDQPLQLRKGATLRAMACRLGYKNSAEARVNFRIPSPEKGKP